MSTTAYRAKHQEELAEKQRLYRLARPEQMLEWRAGNQAKIKLNRREYYAVNIHPALV